MEHAWPNQVRGLEWPVTGMMYSYENKGYVKTPKLDRWLQCAFGPGQAMRAIFNQRIYIMAPRKPTAAEFRWIQDGNARGGVEVEGFGWLTLSD